MVIYRVISYSPKVVKDFESVYLMTQYTHQIIMQGKSYDIQVINFMTFKKKKKRLSMDIASYEKELAVVKRTIKEFAKKMKTDSAKRQGLKVSIEYLKTRIDYLQSQLSLMKQTLSLCADELADIPE